MRKKILSGFLLGTLLLGWSIEGQVSQIVYKNIELEELLRHSSVILVVSGAQPGSSTEELPIDKEGKHPAYRRYKNHFLVLEVLHNRAGLKIDKGPITVLSANDDSQYSMHQDYYLRGISQSPIYPIYKPVKQAAGDQLIIFLNSRPDGQLQFSAESAIESIEEKPRILKSLKRE